MEVHYSSKTDNWATPLCIFQPLDAEFQFTLDAAADVHNTKCVGWYGVSDDSLTQPWIGTVWCNPPYGRGIGKWVKKGYLSSLSGATVVMLIPARTDTAWWHDYVMPYAETRFHRGRISFEHRNCENSRAPFPSAVVIFRP